MDTGGFIDERTVQIRWKLPWVCIQMSNVLPRPQHRTCLFCYFYFYFIFCFSSFAVLLRTYGHRKKSMCRYGGKRCRGLIHHHFSGYNWVLPNITHGSRSRCWRYVNLPVLRRGRKADPLCVAPSVTFTTIYLAGFVSAILRVSPRGERQRTTPHIGGG